MNEFDVIVVGGGNAGLAAAASGAEFGLRVCLVEKQPELGGQLPWSSAHFSAAGTALQRRRGIIDHPELHLREVLEMGHGLANERLTRIAVEAAAEAVDWLDAAGFPFAADAPMIVRGHEPYSRPRTYWGGDDPTAGGKPLLRTLLGLIERADPPITVMTSTRLTGLRTTTTTDGARRVTGIDVTSEVGSATTLSAASVILATGGYAADRELVATFQPRYADALTGCLPHATGDAHRLLMDLGVPMTHGDTYCPTMGMIEDPDRPGFGLHIFATRVIVNPLEREPWEIWVNDDGERFGDESAESPFEREAALRAQPGLAMWVVFDEGVLEAAPPVLGPNFTAERMRATVDEARIVTSAPTIQELARRIRVPEERLVATVNSYNEQLAREDAFGRTHRPRALDTAPFHAIRVRGGMLLSRGGPTVDDDLRPLDDAGRPLIGCFAVGEILGMGQFSGDSFAGGMSVGPALSLGRLAAAKAAALRESEIAGH
jgi:fumarate reductase flavoprotein subunit